MGRLSFSIIFLTMLLSHAAGAATLNVEITGLGSDNGDVHIALYDRPEAFPKSDGMRLERQVSITDRKASLVFTDLEPGLYAIAVYHDENANNDFDQGFLGIPLEDYGFSNNARVFFGPPAFDEAAFRVEEPATRIGIDLGN